jgi:hypothetical protein
MKKAAWALVLVALGTAAGGCSSNVPGKATPVFETVTQPAPVSTVVVPAPSVVVQQPPVTVTHAPSTVQAPDLTPCQRMFAEGYSFDYAYSAWVNAGYPQSWDADKDGIPCEQSYGER